MRVNVFVAIATHGDEEFLVGVNANRRLLEIQKDAYLRNNIEWACAIQEHAFDITPPDMKREVLDDEQQEEMGTQTTAMPTSFPKMLNPLGLKNLGVVGDGEELESGTLTIVKENDDVGVSKETDIS
jgi:hypothetical protein